MEHWTPEELTAYKRAIRLAPKQKEVIEAKRKRKLNTLFNRIIGKPKEKHEIK